MSATGRGKQAIENHFGFNLQLEALLSETGRSELRQAMRSIGEHCHIHYSR